MTDQQRARRPRVPVLVLPGAVFLVIGIVTSDVWAYAAGGALLLLASLQWSRG